MLKLACLSVFQAIGHQLCCCEKRFVCHCAHDTERHWSLQAANTQLEGLQAEVAELKTNRQQAEHSLAAMKTHKTVAEGALKDVRKQRQQAVVDLKGEKKRRQGAEEALRTEQVKGDQLVRVSYQNTSTVLVGFRPCCLLFVLKPCVRMCIKLLLTADCFVLRQLGHGFGKLVAFVWHGD